jgi:hypothetical protein
LVTPAGNKSTPDSGSYGPGEWTVRGVALDGIAVVVYLALAVGSEYVRKLFPDGKAPIAVAVVVNINEWSMVVAAAHRAIRVLVGFVRGLTSYEAS